MHPPRPAFPFVTATTRRYFLPPRARSGNQDSFSM
jgi:hypothetical protein